MSTVRTLAATAVLVASALSAQADELSAGIKNVVLVHGGFVDGSGWSHVYQGLRKDGYNVSIVQNPTTSLADDVAATKLVISQLSGPVILVGHSYGGVVISEAGTDPRVRALVYISAFAPDKGESVQSLIAHPAPGAPVPPILPPQNGFLFLDRAKFAEAFAADVAPTEAAFMAQSPTRRGRASVAGTWSPPTTI
jgi:pimeloyl-ACP methyl ester carboxylesterase